jgi:hypothetical protein
VCCTEVVSALRSGETLVIDRNRELRVHRWRDHTFHELEVEHFRCRARFDLRALTAELDRSRFRDAST